MTDDVVMHNGCVSVVIGKVTVKSGVGMGLPMVGLLINIVEVGMTEAAAICVSIEDFDSGSVAVASFAQ